jgi:ABC-2 type transport system permease protein
MVGPIYNYLAEDLLPFIEYFPEVLLVAFGAGDLSTPEGFYQVETFGFMAPIALMLVTITVAARGLAGEEERRTMGLLLANPIKRSKVVIEKAWAMTVCAFVIGFAIFAGVWLGSLLGGLGMDVGNIAATCLLATLLGLFIGSLALTLSAATGRIKITVFGTIGATGLFYLTSSFLPLNESLADLLG